MKTRRWMQTVLNEAKTEQVDLPWTRKARAKRGAEAPTGAKAAG